MSTDVIALGGLQTERQLLRLARGLLERRDTEGTVELDLSPLDRAGGGASHVRVSATWASLLSNLLLGALSDTTLRVTLPSNHGVMLQLARGGVTFALAHHSDCTIVSSGDSDLEGEMDRWRDDWQPADPAQTSFFDEPYWHAPDEVEPRFLAFINPDRSPMATAEIDRTNAIAPWLNALTRRVLPDPIRREHLLGDVSMAVSELAENIVYHAKLIDRDSCYVFVYATKGPSRDSANRLSIVAHDTGIGIDASLAPDFGDSAQPGIAGRVAAPFNMRMRHYGRDRGKGLARVIAMARRRGGASMFAATSLADDPSCAVILTGTQSGEFRPSVLTGLPLTGTLVSISFRLSFPNVPRSRVRSAQREAARLRPQQLELLGSE